MRKIEIEEFLDGEEIAICENKKITSIFYCDIHEINRKGPARSLGLRLRNKIHVYVGCIFLDDITIIDDKIRKLTIESALFS